MGALQGPAGCMNARIIELFSSIQGEGLWVGRPQVFVRFHGCKLKCKFCDTPLTHAHIKKSRVEYPPYSKQFEDYPLEFSIKDLNQQIERFKIPSLALTGGEPLEQVEFLKVWLPTLEGRFDILLETSGVETEALKQVLPFIHMISLDLKIPSATGESAYWKEHETFLSVAIAQSCYAKIVFDEGMLEEEMEQVERLLQKFQTLLLIFQPVSPIQKRDLKKCFKIFERFSVKYPKRVRLIPQMHKFLSVL